MARKLTWLLIGSGLLNVLLIGVLLGTGFSARFRHRPHHPPHPLHFEGLSPASERLLDNTMEAVHDKNQALRSEFRQTQAAIFQALAAPQFDREVYLSRIQKLHNLHGQRVFNLAEALADVAPQLSPQERASLARQLERDQPAVPPPDGPPPPPHD